MTTSPDSSKETASTRDILTYVLPFGIFMLGLAAVGAVQKMAGPDAPFLLREPIYWIYPLQAILCAAALVWAWKRIDFGEQRGFAFATLIGIGVFFLWVSPQLVFGADPRIEGFDPAALGDEGSIYWMTVLGRFFRLVIVVPIMEEVFWRGFLMRYLINENFTKVPLGKYTHLSFWAVTGLFGLAHWGPDFVPALITGALFGWVFVRTKSLTAVILCHAITNLALGIFIMRTGQFGFW